jgi:hypothetical protein
MAGGDSLGLPATGGDELPVRLESFSRALIRWEMPDETLIFLMTAIGPMLWPLFRNVLEIERACGSLGPSVPDDGPTCVDDPRDGFEAVLDATCRSVLWTAK